AFVRAHGDAAQVLVLGAGYDARAVRLAHTLRGARVFEVDHPATQARKRAILARVAEEGTRDAADLARATHASYLAWDFEARPLAELPRALADAGHLPDAPTVTIWEGVTMYLTPPAIEASFAAIGALSAPGSELVMTYFDRERIDRP